LAPQNPLGLMLATCQQQCGEAARAGAPPIGLVQALRDVDADGRTALALAAHGQHSDLVASLLESRAEANAVDAKGNTPLMLASAKGERHAVECLLEARANPALQNTEGQCAVDLAAGSELRAVLQAQANRNMVEKKMRSGGGGACSLPSLTGKCAGSPKPTCCTLRLDGLPARHEPDYLQELLLDILDEYDVATPKKVDVAVDPITQRPSGHAYIVFSSEKEAQNAESTLRKDSKLRVSLETTF